MKLKDCKLIKKSKNSKYELTIELTDKDLHMVENLALTYAPFQYYQDNKEKFIFGFDGEDPLSFTEEYRKWLSKLFSTFTTPWRKFYG